MDFDDWTPCDLADSAQALSADELAARWPALHVGNHEPWPESRELQEAWRLYHNGQFAQAAAAGAALGTVGAVVVAFATTIQAQYVETDEERKAQLFKQAIAGCEQALRAGAASVNLHYMHAVALGRYSQLISAIEALAQGFAGRIKDQIDAALALDAGHAEAHATLAGWHAAITSQAGGLVARMMYGATEDAALEHYERAIALAPSLVVAPIEKARGLETMSGDAERAAIVACLDAGLRLAPADVMQKLDQREAATMRARY